MTARSPDRRDPDWNDWRLFLEAVRDGSLSGAARNLGLTQPTLGRRLDALESAIGSALFIRSPRGLSPTPAALALLPHAEAMESSSAALARTAAGERSPEGGVMRITASEIVGCEVLPAMLAGFRAAHPGIAIELALTNRLQDLGRRDADIAVRMARPTQSSLVARRIGETHIGLYAHRDYLARAGTPRSPRELKEHRLIGFDRDERAIRAVGALARDFTRESFAFRCDNDVAQLAALRAGVGIGGCQDPIAARTPELARVLPDLVVVSLEIWLVMHEALRETPRARALFDHLVAGLTDYVRGRWPPAPFTPARAPISPDAPASPEN